MIRRLARCQAGAVALEFALLLPVFVFLLLGLVEFGRAMWIRQSLQFAVETASRAALADATLNTTALSALVGASLPGMNGVAPTVTVTATSTEVDIAASYSFSFLAPGILPFGPITLSAQSNTPR